MLGEKLDCSKRAPGRTKAVRDFRIVEVRTGHSTERLKFGLRLFELSSGIERKAKDLTDRGRSRTGVLRETSLFHGFADLSPGQSENRPAQKELCVEDATSGLPQFYGNAGRERWGRFPTRINATSIFMALWGTLRPRVAAALGGCPARSRWRRD